MRRRLVLAALGLCLGLVLAEGVLRARYPDLPSLAGLQDSRYAARADAPYDCFSGVAPTDRPGLVVGEGEPRRRIWVLGDSVANAQGVDYARSYAALLASRLAQAEGGAVAVRNLALPGAGMCGVLGRLDEALAGEEPPDLVLLGLFADDLQARAVVAVQGVPVAFPDQEPSPVLRWAAGRSYLVNLAWFAGLLGSAEAPQRFVEPAAQAELQARVPELVRQVQARGGQIVVSLVEPVGIGGCPSPPEAGTRCAAMAQDALLMAGLLAAAGVDFVDLRGLWPADPSLTLPEERHAELPIHPNSRGHAMLAEALWPAVQAAAAR